MRQRYTGEPPDTRMLFTVYQWAALACGAACIGWAPMFFRLPLADYPLGDGYVPRLAGFAMLALAPLARAAALVEGLEAKKSTLTLWAVGHGVALSGLLFQSRVIMDHPGAGVWVAASVLSTGLMLFGYARLTLEGMPWGGLLADHQTLFGDPRDLPGGPAANLRSSYEQQIRAAAAQEERNRLARDLHDSIKQQIFVIQTAAATAQARSPQDTHGAAQALEQVRSSAREAMTEMEVMLEQLRAAPLENAGLVEALKKHAEALRFRTGADVTVNVGDLPPNETLPPGTHDAIFRVAQEALSRRARRTRRTDAARTRGAATPGPWPLEQGDRRRALHQRGNGQDARRKRALEAAGGTPRPGDRPGAAAGAGHARRAVRAAGGQPSRLTELPTAYRLLPTSSYSLPAARTSRRGWRRS